ncbi:MAG: hypothetical protein DMF59_01780, partial [Acidobacteria bacterium]
MRKFLIVLLAGSLTLACGKGKEAKEEEEGTDDQALQTSATAATTATSAAATAPAAAVSADAATITGTVKLTAAPPAMPALQMSADPYCASQHASAPAKDEEVVAGPGGELENVFVYIKQINGNFPPSSTPVVIDQHGCQYHPHVLALQVGQPLQIKNSDNTLHNIHALPTVNPQFNEGQPVQGMVSTKKFDKPEITPFKVKCDVHGWMKAWMAVLPHPF